MKRNNDAEFTYSALPRSKKKIEAKVRMHNDLKRLMFINSMYNFVQGLIEPFLVIFFNQFGSIEEVGISVAIMYILEGIVSFFASKLLLKIDAKKVLLVTQIANCLRVFGFVFAQNVYWVYAMQLFGGVILGFNMPAYSNVYVKVMSDESSSSIGTHSSSTTIAYGLSALASGFLIESFGYQPVLALWALEELFYGFYIYFVV